MSAAPERNETVPLATGFPAPSDGDWRALAKRTLGAASLEGLDRTTYDGIAVPAMATATGTPLTPALAAMRHGGAAIRPLVAEPTADAANAAIHAEIEGGAEEILLQIDSPGQAGVAIRDAADLATALAGTASRRIAVHLSGSVPAAMLDCGALAPIVAPPARPSPGRCGGLGLDPLGWAATGAIRLADLAEWTARSAALAAELGRTASGVAVFSASGLACHESGGSEAQELASMLAAGLAYLRAGEVAGIALDEAAPRIALELAADCELFLTVAKLRAARILWARLLEACGLDGTAAPLAARTSARMMCRADPHTNMLRTTAAALAAGIGGADAVTVLPFTHPAGRPDSFARRIARNTQAILREEGFIGAVADPAAGAFAIEHLTSALAERAWTLFREIESEGGLAAALGSGAFQSRVARIRGARARDLTAGDAVLVGATAYRVDAPQGGAAPWPVRPPVESEVELLRPIRLESLAES